MSSPAACHSPLKLLLTASVALASLLVSLPASAQDKSKVPDKSAMVKEVASLLEACSYDGSPIKIDTSTFSMSNLAAGKAVISQIMNFTGLPPNFDIYEGKVPNAAAAMALTDDKVLRRIIAYNPNFIKAVREATEMNDWTSVSIMAHEVGHHLSGHTLMRGGSQPALELEADKFSGFILQKMGASLADARKAMETFGSDADGETHPGRTKRLHAITEGWQQSCLQAGRSDCSSGGKASATIMAAVTPPAQQAQTSPKSAPLQPTAAVAPPAAAPAQPVQPKPGIAGQSAPPTQASPEAPAPVVAARTVPTGPAILPKISTEAIPSKFDRFVYDETGLMDKDFTAKIEQQMYNHARDTGTEIVTLIVKDLQGLEPDAYAQAMLNLMRIGKMDVGNGAVLVYAPEQKQFGMALGSGIMSRVKGHTERYAESAKGFFEDYYDYCKEKGQCSPMQTELFFDSADHLRRDTGTQDWLIRYPDFASLHEKAVAESSVMLKDITKSEVRGRISRIRGTVEKLDGKDAKQVNPSIVGDGFMAVTVRGDNNVPMVMYVLPSTMGTQPSKLEEGKTYSFVARSQFVTGNLKDRQGFEALSYVLAQ